MGQVKYYHICKSLLMGRKSHLTRQEDMSFERRVLGINSYLTVTGKALPSPHTNSIDLLLSALLACSRQTAPHHHPQSTCVSPLHLTLLALIALLRQNLTCMGCTCANHDCLVTLSEDESQVEEEARSKTQA